MSMSNMDSTPGAGPSKPRQSSTSTTLEPPTPKARRRSWFPFGSSASTTTSSTDMPPPPLPLTNSSRKSKKGGKEPEVELELSPMTPRQSVDMAMSRSRSSNREEVLTIDGQIDSEVEREKNLELSALASLKKKKKKRRSKGEEEEGEAMRMTDFKPARRTSTASDASGRTEMPNGNQRAFTERTFTRTASDRLSFPESHPSGLVKPPPRISSIPSVPPGKINRIPSDTSNKEQPPIPVDRPLPPLPPEQASKSGSTPPNRPAEIVVTPSSPQKDRHDNERGREYRYHDATSLGAAGDEMRFDRRSRSANGSRDRERTIRSSPIGLGLPRQLVPHDNDHDHPPPVPSKKQSVSTPLPSRTPSPIPRIAFIEPDEAHEDRGRTPTVSRNGTKNVKRARSLSGIFKSSPVVTSVTPTHSRPGTPDPKDGEEQQQEGAGGLMGWLGMKKTIKRRQSETHLRQNANTSKVDQPQPDIPRVPSPAPRGSHDSQTAIRSTRSSFVDLVSRGSQDSASRPPSRNSSTAIMAASPSKKLGSLFSRRQSSKQTESSSSTGPSPPMPLPTKSNSHQQSSGATSSRSSFSLPPFDTSLSPIYPQSGPWMSSPATEMDEEMLFSPESGSNWGPGMRPWMDGTDPPQRSARTSLSSPPMGSLPERGILEGNMDRTRSPDGEGQGQSQNRGRSHSDAPPPSAVQIQDPQSGSHHSPGGSPGLRLAASLSSSPVAGSRPKLGNRANSGNAAIIDRMKGVFARNSSRQRASTLLPEPTYSVHVDEFGTIRHSQDESQSPSNASSPSFSSPQQAPGSRVSFDDPANSHGSLLGLQDAERRRIYHDNGSNRSSIAASIASQATSTSAQLPAASDICKERSFIGRARPRASTMSSGPTNQPFTPPSPVIFPAAATPPRRRPSAIRKLSNTLLGTSPRSGAAPSPKSSSLFPLPPRSSGSISSGLTQGSVLAVDDIHGLGPTSTASPRPSMGSIIAAPTSALPNFKQIAKRQGDETPEQYVDRISSIIPRNEIAGALATSSDSFFFEALKRYMARFDFEHQPLDIALRQLLMHMSLPKETQQIDRVMEAFAARYEECEPSLFKQHDNTYVLAFSMMMLHTDAFNKHNKNKMSKADYVRNTRLDGVSSLVLEAFYDNITFTPFVFIDDDADLQPANTSPDISTPLSSGMSTPGSMPPPKSSKIDVYHMIVNRQLRALQVDIEKYIPSLNPYSCQGSALALDTEALHQTFTKAQLLQVTLPGRRKTSTGILSSTPTRGAPSVEVTLKVVRVGQLSRMDDTHENGKKSNSNRKWKSWSVILTGTQLLFFKDPSWATTLQERSRRLANDPSDQSLLLPPTSTFKPDEVFPLKDCVAVFDQSSSQLSTSTTFRFVMPQGRQYLLSAPDQMDMNDWIGLINYAAVFKTAGVKMRGIAMNKDQAVLAGAAAAASHKRDVQGSVNMVTSTPRSSSSSSEARPTTTTMSSSIVITTPKKAVFGEPQSQQRPTHDTTGPPVTPSKSDTLKAEKENAKTVDVDAADDVVVDEGEQLEKVFDVVKAELAAGRGGATAMTTATRKQSYTYRPNSDGSDTLPVPPLTSNSTANGSTVGASRASALMSQIERYTTKRNSIASQLDSYTITTRNLAILAPFQKITRDRIITALSPLSESVKADRIQWIKYETWIQILQQDLEKDEQEWARVRHVALQAAAKSLKDPKGVKGVVDDVNASANASANGFGNRDVPTTLPRLSLPDSTESGSSYSSPVSPLDGIGSGPGSLSGLGSSPGELPIIIRRPSTSDDLQRHKHTHTHTHTHSTDPKDGDQRRSRHRDRERTVRPSSTSTSTSQPNRDRDQGEGIPQSRPRYYRSNSSLLSADDHETTTPPTGRSTPLMFNLSETEDNPMTKDTKERGGAGAGPREKAVLGAGAGADEEAEDWEKTRASKRVSLASVEIPEEEMKKLSLKKRDREREVTARYIGPDPGPEKDKDRDKDKDKSGH